MTYIGHVRNGVIVLPEGTPLADGTRVRVWVEPSETPAPAAPAGADPMAATRAWMLQMAREMEELAPDLPSDLSKGRDDDPAGR